MRESPHDQAFDLSIALWRRHMRRFFFAELPGCFALLFAVPYVSQHAGSHAPAVKRVLITFAVLLIAYVWIRRMPPERPSPNGIGVLNAVDHCCSPREPGTTISPSGPAA